MEGVGKSFGSRKVLSGVSFSIARGELVALIGPSGSGKSTLLKMIARQLFPDEGAIWVDDKKVGEFKQSKDFAKRVGILSQSLDLVEELSVLNNVLIGRMNEWGALRSLCSLLVPQDRGTAMEALQKMGIADKAREKTMTLSGGEKQRVAFARLLVQNPELVLADEPISSLDPTRANDVLSLLTGMAKNHGITLLTSLHSVEHVRKYFSRAIGISNGSLRFDLPIAELSGQMLEELYQKREEADA